MRVEAAPATTSAPPLYVPAPPEGCARTGSLESVEADPTCLARSVDDSSMRDAMKNLDFTLTPDSAAVSAGGMVIVRLTITSTSKSEVALVLDASPVSAAARPDWSRLAGVPEPKPGAVAVPPSELYRLVIAVRTLDAQERSVDALPTTNGSDAGHRFVPKTAPLPLATGDYTIKVDLPLHGVSTAESTVSARVRVERAENAETREATQALRPREARDCRSDQAATARRRRTIRRTRASRARAPEVSVFARRASAFALAAAATATARPAKERRTDTPIT